MVFDDEIIDFEDPEDAELMRETGRRDEDIYDEEGREGLLEDDEIEPWEQGFMEGAEGGGQDAKCRQCGRVLMGPEDTVEKRIKGHLLLFCSELCSENFEDHLEEHMDQLE